MTATRCWINQPSTLQAGHQYNGLNVIAEAPVGGMTTVYPVSGGTISMRIPHSWLSNGWRPQRPELEVFVDDFIAAYAPADGSPLHWEALNEIYQRALELRS